jgi:lysophospholipase L1-like esterase
VDGLAPVLLLALLPLAAGCGDAAEHRATTLVATLGDSITAGSPGYDPDPRMREVLGFGADEKSQWQYWAQKAHPELRFRNCGVYGERTDQIAKRLNECARGARVLVVQGGINDLAQGRPVRRAAANLRRMVERGKTLGLRVAVANLLPWNTATTSPTARSGG